MNEGFQLTPLCKIIFGNQVNFLFLERILLRKKVFFHVIIDLWSISGLEYPFDRKLILGLRQSAYGNPGSLGGGSGVCRGVRVCDETKPGANRLFETNKFR